MVARGRDVMMAGTVQVKCFIALILFLLQSFRPTGIYGVNSGCKKVKLLEWTDNALAVGGRSCRTDVAKSEKKVYVSEGCRSWYLQCAGILLWKPLQVHNETQCSKQKQNDNSHNDFVSDHTACHCSHNSLGMSQLFVNVTQLKIYEKVRTSKHENYYQ